MATKYVLSIDPTQARHAALESVADAIIDLRKRTPPNTPEDARLVTLLVTTEGAIDTLVEAHPAIIDNGWVPTQDDIRFTQGTSGVYEYWYGPTHFEIRPTMSEHAEVVMWALNQRGLTLKAWLTAPEAIEEAPAVVASALRLEAYERP